MLFPGSTYGTIEFNNNVYPILNSPITSKQIKIISDYKSENSMMMTLNHFASTMHKWRIIEKSLYLVAVNIYKFKPNNPNSRIRVADETNFIEKIFKRKQVFADWFSSSLKLEVSRNKLCILESGHSIYQQEILELSLERGEIYDTKEYKQTYQVRRLKNYIID